MAVSSTIRRILVVALALVVPVTLAPAATAARPSTASVTLTSPADGATTLVGGVTLVGKASVPTGSSLVVTVDGAVTGAPVAVAKNGTWQRFVYVGVVGAHRVCAQVRSSDAVLASSCVTWEMVADPDQFSLASPYDGQRTYGAINAGGACQPGASVRLVLDGGDPLAEACDPDGYGWSHLYADLAVGDHTLEATLLGADGSPLATRSVTFTVEAIPQPDVEITSPEDGTSGTSRRVDVAGTVTNIHEYVRFTVDGQDLSSLYVGGTTATVPWQTTLGLPYGTHEVCAVVDGYYDSATTDTDCIIYTVEVDPATFTVSHPQDGGTVSGPDVGLAGDCTPGTSVEVVLETGASGSGACDDFSRWVVFVDGAVADGTHTATVTNSFEDTLVSTTTVTFTSDSTPPAPPVVVAPAPGSTITTVPVEVYGTGEPGGTVEISFPGTTYHYTTAQVQSDGTWTTTLYREWFDQAGLLTGKRATATVTFTQTDQFGRVSEPTSLTWTTRVR